MKYYNKDPYIIRARFDSVCNETGATIKKGEQCIYYPASKKVFSMDSKQADAYRSWRFDVTMLGANY